MGAVGEGFPRQWCSNNTRDAQQLNLYAKSNFFPSRPKGKVSRLWHPDAFSFYSTTLLKVSVSKLSVCMLALVVGQ